MIANLPAKRCKIALGAGIFHFSGDRLLENLPIMLG